MSTDLLPRQLRRAVSPYTGIVRSLEECLQSSTDPPLHQFAAEVGALGRGARSGAAAPTRRDAAAAAVGEALERYSASTVPVDRLVVGSARELGAEAVEPGRFALFSRRQHARRGFPFRPFTRETPVAWVEGYSLPERRRALLPAELVFLGGVAPRGSVSIGYATSSGTACATRAEDALVRGLCELLERDAFMIVWANRLSLPVLDWSADEAISALDRTLFAPVGLPYRAIDLSVFHRLPSVLGVVRAPAGYPGALGVGAGTAPTVERAWWKALSEAFAARAASVKLALVAGGRRPAPDEIASFDDHIRYYVDRHGAARFLDGAVEPSLVGDLPSLEGATAGAQLAALCARVAAAGSTAYAVDVTAPDVRALGLAVLKVLAPELCPLDVLHRARFLGGRRLYEAAWQLGLRARPLREHDVNTEPHPFP